MAAAATTGFAGSVLTDGLEMRAELGADVTDADAGAGAEGGTVGRTTMGAAVATGMVGALVMVRTAAN